MHWNILVRILAFESYRDDYYCPKLVKYAVNDPVSLCGMNTKDIFLATTTVCPKGRGFMESFLISAATMVVVAGETLNILFISRSAWPKI
ncbi:MAG: hypothetical protein ACLQT6_16555 [Desulfomonilaceae bacterium]